MYSTNSRSFNLNKSLPSTIRRPADGRSNPPIMFRNVLLPLPLLPMIAISSPRAISSSNPCSANTSMSLVLYIFTRFSQVIIGSVF